MKCLFCYKRLDANETDFHTSCSKKFFGQPHPPVLPYTENELEKLAFEVLKMRTTVPGVQPKISLHLESGNQRNTPKKFTIVGLWGGYILKPPSPFYSQLPEVEDLTMHLAAEAKIQVVPHSLIRMKNFSLIHHPVLGAVFSPAYDLLSTALVNPADDEDMALTLNGKKKKINQNDFFAFFNTLKLDLKQQENILGKMKKAKSNWFKQIEDSFLGKNFQTEYKILIENRFERLK